MASFCLDSIEWPNLERMSADRSVTPDALAEKIADDIKTNKA